MYIQSPTQEECRPAKNAPLRPIIGTLNFPTYREKRLPPDRCRPAYFNLVTVVQSDGVW